MDRYFYTIEQDDNGNKVVHMQGNIYYNDERMGYENAEWTFMFLEISEVKRMLDTNTFYDYVNGKVAYFDYITEENAIAITENYFDEDPGAQLHIADITEDTPCGNYWWDADILCKGEL